MSSQPETGEMRSGRRKAPWERLEKWQQVGALAIAAVASLFGAGVTFQRARAAVVMVDVQKAVDSRQDAQINAVLDDAGRMHVSLDDLHDEVRGMRTDLRYFDPRRYGGGLPELPAEPTRPAAHPLPTSTSDPSMGGFLVPSPSPTSTSGP